MRIGLVARCDSTGLGVQTKEFYDHIKPDKTLVVDITAVNQSKGKIAKTYPRWYTGDNVKFVHGFPNEVDFNWLLTDIDLVFTIESPYSYRLFSLAKEKGVISINQFNYEFLDYFVRPDWAFPDVLAAPTNWNLDDVRNNFSDKVKIIELPVPINREVLTFTKKTKARRFLHIAGHKTEDNRNGTDIVLEAIPLVKSKNVEFIIKSQFYIENPSTFNTRIDDREVENYWENYVGEYDCLLLPRKYGGLSLQLQESLSRGLVPIMTNLPPQNEILEAESLINTDSRKMLFTRMHMPSHQTKPQVLADKIDQLASDDKLVERLSEKSNEIAERLSWNKMRQVYLDTFEQCLK